MSKINNIVKQGTEVAKKYLTSENRNKNESNKQNSENNKENDSKNKTNKNISKYKGLLPGPVGFSINGPKRILNGGKIK